MKVLLGSALIYGVVMGIIMAVIWLSPLSWWV